MKVVGRPHAILATLHQSPHVIITCGTGIRLADLASFRSCIRGVEL